MKNTVFAFLGLILVIFFSSCRDDFDFELSSGRLGFSQDTVFLDTVFTNIGSSTRTFKVYNRSSDDIVIPRVALGQGNNSRYRLSVDGVPGQVFENVELLAQDSLFVFVETTVDIMDFGNGLEFLYEDVIQFDSGPNLQEVQLVTLVKDAIFLFPARDSEGNVNCLPIGDPEDEICIPGFFLEDNQLLFTADKPYVIYGFAAIPPNKTMTIEAGARLHFHANSGIIAANEASLKVNGALSTTDELENEVIFEGDRLEPAYDDVPGQWAAIWLTAGSRDHEFNHATIKNASVGILMDSSNPASNGATLKINNTQIYNSAAVGLLGTTADIEAENVVIAKAGQSAFVGRLGGSYNFNNCTLANYWDQSLRQDPTLLLSNTIPNSGLSEPLTEATFSNSIIYGDRDIELLLLDNGTSAFNFNIANSLLKFDDRFGDFENEPLYDFSNLNLYDSIILNEDPVFQNVDRNQLRIDNSSPANGLADPASASSIDILGESRGTNPDAGAYESVDLDSI
jgi:hypothetical protein